MTDQTMTGTLASALKEMLATEAYTATFVYGTLMSGHYNFDWASKGVVQVVLNCTAQGKIYFVHGRSGFPVAKLDEAGEICGEILIFKADSREYAQVCSMELGAGYELRDILVTLPDESFITVEAWHYVDSPMGDLIESGDWASSQRF